MAKAKRTTIGFQPATYAALEDLADASGSSIAGLVSGFMDEAAPSLASIAQALRAAKTKPIEALDLMQEQLVKAHHAAAQGNLELVEARKRHNKRRVPQVAKVHAYADRNGIPPWEDTDESK